MVTWPGEAHRRPNRGGYAGVLLTRANTADAGYRIESMPATLKGDDDE
jgi:hypothetical protein